MPKIGQPLYTPFRVRRIDDDTFVTDTNVANYTITAFKNGAPWVPGGGFTIIDGGGLGRHILTFTPDTEAQYIVFLDHNTHEASIESAWSFPDQYLSGDIVAEIQAGTNPTAIADAVWDALSADHLDAGSMGAFLKRILQLAQPDVVVDNVGNTITLKDKDTGDVLVTYDVTGTLDTRVEELDG